MQSLLETACKNTQARHAKTMSRQFDSERQFDFLKELVENIPDLPTNEEEADDLDEPKPKRYAGVKLEGGGCVCGWGVGVGGGTPKILKTPLGRAIKDLVHTLQRNFTKSVVGY